MYLKQVIKSKVNFWKLCYILPNIQLSGWCKVFLLNPAEENWAPITIEYCKQYIMIEVLDLKERPPHALQQREPFTMGKSYIAASTNNDDTPIGQKIKTKLCVNDRMSRYCEIYKHCKNRSRRTRQWQLALIPTFC